MSLIVEDEFKVVNVDCDEFWKKMCSIGFYRIDLNRGAIGSTLYKVKTPPEKVKGFFESKIIDIAKKLSLTECL